MVCITDLRGPSLISFYPLSSFYSPVGTLTPPMPIFLSSVHCLLSPALPMYQYFHLVHILFTFRLLLVFAPYKAQLGHHPHESSTERLLQSPLFLGFKTAWNLKQTAVYLLGCGFTEMLSLPFPRWFFSPVFGETISHSFSVSCWAWLDALNSAGFELMLLIDCLKCLTRSKQSNPFHSASLVGGQLERDGCSVLRPVASVVG